MEILAITKRVFRKGEKLCAFSSFLDYRLFVRVIFNGPQHREGFQFEENEVAATRVEYKCGNRQLLTKENRRRMGEEAYRMHKCTVLHVEHL